MDYTVRPAFDTHLAPHERLLWAGKPKEGILFRRSDWLLIPFSLLWCGFTVFWLSTAFTAGAPLFFLLIGIPFVGMGLLFVVGRFFLDARLRANTFYGITEDQILIKSGLLRSTLKSLNPKVISEIEYTENADGSGTIHLGPKHPMQQWMSGMSWWPGAKAAPTLEEISEVRKVYKLIGELQRRVGI